MNHRPTECDVVVTWVDDSDPEWRKRRARHVTTEGNSNADHVSRWRNYDEIRYCLRSIHDNAPWVRKIFLVTDSQRPSWLMPGGTVEVIDHRDIFPDQSFLPTFNSRAIEACIQRIPNLTNHFVYFNDDIFLCKKTTIDDFFSHDGWPVAYTKKEKIFSKKKTSGSVHLSGINRANSLLLKRGISNNNPKILKKIHHAPYALNKEIINECVKLFPEEIRKTRANQLRSKTDIATTNYLYFWYGFNTGRGKEIETENSYNGIKNINISKAKSAREAAFLLRNNETKFLCLNDSEDGKTPFIYRKILCHLILSRLFPSPAPWEKT